MSTQNIREKLGLLVANLPDIVQGKLLDIKLDILVVLGSISDAHEFVIGETESIWEGVRRVFMGEDSPNNLVAFIEKDERIEEDNRPKIPEIAYEIQTKIFDPVLPILKQAGFKVKEGRVAEPLMKYGEGSMKEGEAPSSIQNSEFRIQSPQAQSARIPAPTLPGGGASTSLAIDEKNIRALIRIATGTTYTAEQLQDAFLSLPQGLRQSLSSVDTANAIQDIAKRYFLHVDQMAELASETGLVLLGLTHPADFIKNLTRRLRLPEEKAREIARNISMQILVKVREGLRNLHENTGISNTEFRTSNVEKSRDTNSAKLPTTNYQLPTSSTPYSVGAKWNTGENILSKQTQEESSIDRAEVLRGIENPKSIYENANDPKQRIPTNRTGEPISATANKNASPFLKKDSYLEARSYQLKANQVGPTGWKPGQNNEVGSMKYEGIRDSAPKRSPMAAGTPPQVPVPTPLSAQILATPPRNEVPRQTLQSQSSVGQGSMQSSRRLKYDVGGNATERIVPPPPAQKARPQSEVPAYTSIPKPPPQDFLDQKLQAPVAIPMEEKRYTTDPYREPLA